MTRKTHRTVRLSLTVAGASVALLLTMGFTPAANAAASADTGSFSSKLAPVSTTTVVVADSGSAAFSATSAHVRSATTLPTQRQASAFSGGSSSSSSSTATRSGTAPSSESAQAQAILAGYVAKYPILQGATVSFGDAKGYQAICYYRSGRIVISPTHTASLERIIRHEIGHIIDWRDNGVIDWGENIPAL